MGQVEEKIARKRLTPDEVEHRALTLQAIGWLLLAFDGIVAVFVFVGIRSGSWLWFFWTAIEGAVGIALVLAGMRLEQIGSLAMGHLVEPHLHATEDVEHRKAA